MRSVCVVGWSMTTLSTLSKRSRPKLGAYFASIFAYAPACALAILGTAFVLVATAGLTIAQGKKISIIMPAVIVAEPNQSTPLAIQLLPADLAPAQSFIRITGLPKTIKLSHGYNISPGAWAVSLKALRNLRVTAPAAAVGNTTISVSLVSLEGKTLLAANSKLVIAPAWLVTQDESTRAKRKIASPALQQPPSKKPPPTAAPPARKPAARKPKPKRLDTPREQKNAAWQTTPKAPVAKTKPKPPVAKAKPKPPVAKAKPRTPPTKTKPKTQPAKTKQEPASTPANTGSTPAERIPPRPKIALSPANTARAKKLVERGARYMKHLNVTIARQFFQRAAQLRYPPAAIMLGQTYDPIELGKITVPGVAPNIREARRWYRLAKELGSPEADAKLARLRLR